VSNRPLQLYPRTRVPASYRVVGLARAREREGGGGPDWTTDHWASGPKKGGDFLITVFAKSSKICQEVAFFTFYVISTYLVHHFVNSECGSRHFYGAAPPGTSLHLGALVPQSRTQCSVLLI